MIHYSLRQQEHAHRPDVSEEDFLLEETVSIMFFGMYLDQDLTWCDDVDSICANVTLGNFAIQTLDKLCCIEVLKTAYFGLVYPQFSYGIRPWGSCTNRIFQRVFILQKKAIRTIKI